MVVNSYGADLELVELAPPQLQPGCARLEVLTCGICLSDVKTAEGRMPFSDRLGLPHVPGHEVCARVVATDPPGALQVGTIVVAYHVCPCRVCRRCRAGEDNLCRSPRAWIGFTDQGGFAEELVVPLDRLTTVPANIDPVHAAPMTCALGTAYHAVVSRGALSAGMSAVIIGLGGVGIHALQLARLAGASVTGLDRSSRAIEAASKLKLAAELSNGPEPERRLLGATGGEGTDVVIDTVGSPATVRQAERLVRAGGRIVVVGYAVGSEIAVDSARTVLEEIDVVGSRYVRMDELERAIGLVAHGGATTVIDRVEPLERANQAFAALKAGEVVGRAVLDIAGVT